ncbi:YesL family protein [Anaerobacillus sp. CMMVII]|uniref:YesL family protein n=1 Tax=Anaerobacillus sp. CMMVII TaxID=2755588 RepID=UPI0021B77F70|nr:YesL family protein [Anaerobacillus sp. CMMVII]MCT8139612.1 YesL family protein [Anaerobacillus sp. CMMVII]
MMEMGGFMGGFYRISVHISRLAYINVLWIMFTLLGGVVLGIMPATVALFAITRKWVNGEDVSILKSYWKYYKTEFIKSNLLGLFLYIMIVLLYTNFMLLQNDVFWMDLVRYVLFFLTVLFVITVLYLFPIYVHYQLKLSHYVRDALIIGLGYPVHTVLMAVGIFALQFVFMKIPGLIPFFAVSTTSYFVMWLVNGTFVHIEKKRQEKLDASLQVN